jgi:hypothetical protein
LPNDPGAYGGEYGFGPAQVDGNWFAAFDESSFYSIGVVLPQRTAEALPTYAYFLCDPPLGNFTGEYPINPAGSCPDMANLFFEKQFGVLAPGDSVGYEFYQWGGYGHDRQELTELLWRDAEAVSGDPLAVEHDPLGADIPVGQALRVASPNPFTTSTEIAFELPAQARASLAVYDVRGRLVTILLDKILAGGGHTTRWQGNDARGTRLPSGIYFFRLDAAGRQEVQKVVIRR